MRTRIGAVAFLPSLRMIVQDVAGAQIEIVLVSNDRAQIRQLTRDLRASTYAYSFVHLAVSDMLVEAARAQIWKNGGKTPTVMVINYSFAGSDCKNLLQDARTASATMAIECVVTDPPTDAGLRERLICLGARLFDDDPGSLSPELTLH